MYLPPSALRRLLPRPLCWALGASLCALGCGKDEPQPPLPLDPTLFHELREHATIHPDLPFQAPVPTLFRTSDVLPGLDVRALLILEDRLMVGTSTGVFTLDGTSERFVAHSDPALAGLDVRGLAVLGAGRLVVAARDRLVVLGAAAPQILRAPSPGVGFGAVAAGADRVYVATSTGVARWTPGEATLVPLVPSLEARQLAVAGSKLYVATSSGAWTYDLAAGALGPTIKAPAGLVDDDVRALAISSDGKSLFAASALGLAKIPLDGAPATLSRAGLDGLPAKDLLSVTERGGKVLIGHEIGASLLDGVKTTHLHSLRWLPAERVTAVALMPDGTRWLGTPAGLTRVRLVATTLAERAARFEAILEQRHWRMDGFVDDVAILVDAWQPSGDVVQQDHDNDGLWTEMQLGTWCLAYAATGDEQYYLRAKKALATIFLTIDVPAKTFLAAGKSPGFVARTLVRDDEGALFEDKKTRSNWHLEVYEGRQYYWKDNTSSDEYAGHFFGLPLYFDHCAKDDAERAAISARLARVMDYVIAGQYQVIDLDGERTKDGYWNDQAASLDGLDACTAKGHPLGFCLSAFAGGGWLNGLEILGHLLATWHVTGDSKYLDEYERLYTVERYGQLIPIQEHYLTVTDPSFANHSDHELATLAYFTLARYEPHPERRQVLIRAMRDFYEYERKERNAWEASVIGSMVSDDVDSTAAVQTLMEWPEDLRDWAYDNSHRLDANLTPADRFREAQFDRVFPYDELRTMKWNQNPYSVRQDGNGRGILAPTPFLIAYWKLRYFGLLTGP